MATAHAHGIKAGQHERPLWIALGLTTCFMVAEVVAGILTNSLALISDAAHMLTDAAALAISLAAIRIGKQPADSGRTFGYYRFEILAAAFNAILLFLVALYILFEAYQRLSNPPAVQSGAMLAVASLGLVINLISMRLLSSDKDANLNIKGAYLEVWSDMLGSMGVIGAALLIWWTDWRWIDSVVAAAIGIWVLPRTWTLLKASVNVLLEGVPEGVELAAIEAQLRGVTGVTDVHDLHVWAIASGKVSLTVHIVHPDAGARQTALMSAVRELLAKNFDIHHVTIQLEQVPCDQAVSHSWKMKTLRD